MSKLNWLDLLGWSEEQVDSIRFVAYSYIKQGHYDTASTLLEALIVMPTKNSYDLQTLGAIYLQQGKALKALNFLDQALKLEPNHFPSLLNRAKALFLLGYKKQGTKEVEELQKCPDKTIAKEAEALLTSFS